MTDEGIVWNFPVELINAIAGRIATIVVSAIDKTTTTTATPYMTVAEAAEYLRWPKERIYKLTAARAIPHIKHEGRLLFRRGDLDGWLDEFREGPRPRES